MPCPPGHTIYHAIHLHAIPHTMSCPPGDIIYYAISRQAIPYAMPYHIHAKPRQAIPYTMPCPQGHTIHRAIPRQAIRYTVSTRQAISYTMPYPTRQLHMSHLARPIQIPGDARPGPTRPYHIPCHARQTTPYTMPSCPPGNTVYMSARQATPYTIPYLARQYHAMPAWPYYISCHPFQVIPYTMPCPADHTIYHVMHAMPYHIPCQVGSRLSITSLKAETVRVLKVSLPGV